MMNNAENKPDIKVNESKSNDAYTFPSPQERPPANTEQNNIQGMLKTLFIHNPFYLISALLVLYGLNSVYPSNPAGLLTTLASYTILLTATAIIVVRKGHVWEDARTLLLLPTLLIAATAFSLDNLIFDHIDSAAMISSLGLGFAITVSETLLKGCRLRLPNLYKTAYYSSLAIIFLFPLTLLPHLKGGTDTIRSISLLLPVFPTVASVALLPLLLAIKKGKDSIKENGTPWQFPFFPMPLFIPTALCIVARMYYLCISYVPENGMDNPFGIWMLTPFLLTIGILCMTLNRSIKNKKLEKFCLYLPALLMLTMLPIFPHASIYWTVLEHFTNSIASPLYILTGLSSGYYFYGMKQGIPHAKRGFIASLIVLGILNPVPTNGVAEFQLNATIPIFTALYCAIRFYLTRSSKHALMTATSAILSACIQFQNTPFMKYNRAIPAHLLLASILLIGIILEDRFAEVLQNLGALLCLIFFFTAFFNGPELIGSNRTLIYLTLLSCLTFFCGFVADNHFFYKMIAIQSLFLCFITLKYITGFLRNINNPKGFISLSLGLLTFITATVVSFIKSKRKHTTADSRISHNQLG